MINWSVVLLWTTIYHNITAPLDTTQRQQPDLPLPQPQEGGKGTENKQEKVWIPKKVYSLVEGSFQNVPQIWVPSLKSNWLRWHEKRWPQHCLNKTQGCLPRNWISSCGYLWAEVLFQSFSISFKAYHHILGGGFKYCIFYFYLYSGKIPNLTNSFQIAWNHQLVFFPKLWGYIDSATSKDMDPNGSNEPFPSLVGMIFVLLVATGEPFILRGSMNLRSLLPSGEISARYLPHFSSERSGN